MADDIVTQLEWLRDEFYSVDSITSVIDLAIVKIERLRAERDEARAEASMKGYRLDDALDEIDRLRAKVAHLSAWPLFCDRPTECDVCGDVYRSEEARRG